MPEYKLYYFDARGNAEVARLLFAVKGQSFEDIRFTQEQWKTEKANTPFGQMPVLSIDGKKFGQTIGINAYLAREFGLYGKNNLEALAIDQVIQCNVDFIQSFIRSFREQDETKKAELMKTIVAEEIPKYLGIYTRLLKESGTGYFVGDSLTLADLVIFALLGELQNRKMLEDLSNYPELKAHTDKVLTNKNLKAYVDTRK